MSLGNHRSQISVETRRKMSEAARRRASTPEERERLAGMARQQWRNPKFREKMLRVLDRVHKNKRGKKRPDISKLLRTRNPMWNEQARRKVSESLKEAYKDPQYRWKLGHNKKKQWQDPVIRGRFIEGFMKSGRLKMSATEMVADAMIQEQFPGRFKYVGTGATIINGLSPDWIDCNGLKLVLEMTVKTNRPFGNPELRREIYKELGYHSVFFRAWETETKPGRERILKVIRQGIHEASQEGEGKCRY